MEEKNRLIKIKDLDFLNKKEKRNLQKIFDKRVGIINSILERKELRKYQNLYMYQSITSNVSDLFSVSREPSSGGLGVSFNKKKAFLACIGESIERYCMSYIEKSEIKRIALTKNSKKTMENFRYYKDEKYLSGKFLDPHKNYIDYVYLKDYKNKTKKLVPASLVYIPYDKERIAEPTSTGISAHTSIEKAIVSGALEVIERDALMINFTMGLKPPIIELNSIKGKLGKFLKDIQKEYFVRIHKLYTDTGAEVFLSFIWKKINNKFHFGIGGCASLNSKEGIMKSLKECLFTFFYSRKIMDLREKESDKIDGLHKHFLYYQGDNFSKLLSFGGEKIPFKNKKEKDKKIIEKLYRKGFKIYYKDLTTNDMNHIGYKVVKVFIPNFIDLNKSHFHPRVKSKRFYEMPRRMGFNNFKMDLRNPHPFP